MLSGIIPSTRRFIDFLHVEEEVVNCGAVPTMGDIVFHNVSFSYTDSTSVLQNISFKIPKKAKIALVGLNGAGKSTLMDILLRFYEPKQGYITLDNTDISNLSLNYYRDQFSVVSQNIYLFDDTIRNNITLYKSYSNERLARVLANSGILDFVEAKSLDYIIGPNGAKLSGGQKQKIALARALLHDRPIFIFDEVTSNTDMLSEKQINSLLRTDLSTKTVILSSHKPEVLKDVDCIVLLTDNRVKCIGNYNELIRMSSDFRLLVNKETE